MRFSELLITKEVQMHHGDESSNIIAVKGTAYK